MYKNSSKSDIKSADLSVKAEVQRVKVTIMSKFLNRIKVQHHNFFIPLFVEYECTAHRLLLFEY